MHFLWAVASGALEFYAPHTVRSLTFELRDMLE